MNDRRLRLLAAAVALAAVGVVVVVSSGDDEGDDTRSGPTTSTTSRLPSSPPLIGAAGAAGVGDPYFPELGNGGYDVEHYTLSLDWRPQEAELIGRATIEARSTQALSTFNLDLVGMQVGAVTVGGQPAAFERAGRELIITPTDAVAEGDDLVVVVEYSGTPSTESLGTDLFEPGWQVDGLETYVVSEPAGAATFFPVNDHPVDKATYTFEITAPADQVAVANGILVGEPRTDGETRTWTYEARDLLASYLVQVAIGDYELVDGGRVGDVVIRHAFHRRWRHHGTEVAVRTVEMIDVLDDVFGPYPFEAYGLLLVDEPLGFALETQTLTIIGSDVARGGASSEDILLHELAHQWVGNAVSPATWKDVWLNEGFATYSEWLWSERTGGASAAQRARGLLGSSAALGTPPGDPGREELFATTVYWRGGMALQALRERVGDDPFFTLLRRWVDEHRGSVASTAQLVELAEEISGQELDDLFQAWIYAPALPSFDS